MGVSSRVRVVWGEGEGGKMELADFEGAWRLARRIEPDDGPEATFDGRATLTPDGAGLRYVEEGVLRLPGAAPMREGQVYLWRSAPSPNPNPNANAIAVAFEDGRAFHLVDLGDPRPSAVHPCGADLYAVRYDLSRWPEWSAAWRVDGPRKGYAMTTRYTRLEGPGAMGHPVSDH